MSRPGPDKPLKKGATGGLSASAGRNAFETRAVKPPVPPGRIPNSEFRIRAAFTLIEMMISITIMLILTGLTLAVLNVTMDQDRISDSGRTIQAFMEGARDRAIHAGQPRGIRLLLDSNSPIGQPPRPIATSMVYIGSPELYSEGLIRVDTDNRTVHGLSIPNSGTGWIGLSTRGRLITGARIQIPRKTGSWYTISLPSNPLTLERFKLTRAFIDAPPPSSGSPATYQLELTPAVLPNQEPRPLARGIVIDLKQSRLPGSWNGGASSQMDILFSPRGTVTGPLAGEGMIHLVLADIADVENGFAVGASTKEGGELILTVTTQTGNISTHHVDITDITPADGFADDPFRFAELGDAAK